MMRHIIAAAQASGMSHLSLETGSSDYFLPARALYKRHGFVECPPFANYILDPNSVFMTLNLRESARAMASARLFPSSARTGGPSL